ncbi:MAG: hypothetical protein V6Z81_08605 [Parvularculales bacterium]
MKTLTTLLSLRSKAPAVTAIAIVMALAISGPVTFTSAPAHAGDSWDCFWDFEWSAKQNCRN